MLIAAINGDSVTSMKKNLEDFVLCTQFLFPDLIPPSFNSSYLYGKTPNDFFKDIGDGGWGDAIRLLTSALFDTEIIKYRLLKRKIRSTPLLGLISLP